VNTPSRLTVILINALLSAALIAGYAAWLAPSRPPRLAVLDVAELYRLKEIQVAALLVKRGASEDDRTATLERVHGFGAEVTRLIEALPQECRCLILARGALVGPDTQLPDLTPGVRQRLGL
jgi:hypothetical protein